ncbi:PAAR domain-containing protein [Paraburkholderia lycopersici]|uniref:Zn-binding Pro-Ala-Ala-Arg (PAAR) domain-containing protein, incolved in TypeVI secretion n=1 Tax=Paraburkholderia lycopersici TaxID=416944 RepID=A0A1G7BUM7_9BURK|nr:PAAR domain-containing protein [Paraburkholderia lycopersici]SDE29895.1 Zn-binding Pro-Ala-Ala-Arg (PAAR) domain-containing protein, incolved in TypeVI secretion [Paraburkholderia lycopersici]
MPNPIATLGTPTTHGGVVVSCAPGAMIDGRLAACVGDQTVCPMQGPGVITSGSMPTINGRQVAHHGSSTSCGATLIVPGAGPTV